MTPTNLSTSEKRIAAGLSALCAKTKHKLAWLDADVMSRLVHGGDTSSTITIIIKRCANSVRDVRISEETNVKHCK